MKPEIKDYMDRGVQLHLSDDKQRLMVSGPDGVINLTLPNVALLVDSLGAALPGMVSAPVPNSESIAPQGEPS